MSISTDMIAFKHFFNILAEANFRDVPESIVKQANRIANSYRKQVPTLTKTQFKQLKMLGLNSNWRDYFDYNEDNVWFVLEIDKVRIKDLKTNKLVMFDVLVAFGENNENYAICDNTNKFIILYDDVCRQLSEEKLVSVIVHELTHGFQQHKEYSKKYKKLVDTKAPEAKLKANSLYHKEPIEFDAFTTEIAHTIRAQYHKLKNNITNAKMPETKKLMERKLEKFLLELKLFIKSPLETYFVHKELNLPKSMETFEDMLKSIQENPTLWKSFKNKLLNLYTKLSTNEQ